MANAHGARTPRDERGEVDPRARAALAGGGGCLARPRATRWVGGWWSQQGHDRRPRFVYHPARADEVAPHRNPCRKAARVPIPTRREVRTPSILRVLQLHWFAHLPRELRGKMHRVWDLSVRRERPPWCPWQIGRASGRERGW